MCCSLLEVGDEGTASGLAVGLQILRDRRKLFQRSFEVGGDVGGDDLGRGEVGGFLQGFVLQPEDVEVELVAFGEFFVGEGLESVDSVAMIVRGQQSTSGLY